MAQRPSQPAPFSRAPLPRRIAHCDLDVFFVAVERLRDPTLIGQPVLIGGRGPRSVVATASYEARVFGCHSAQPMGQALRLCPQAIVVQPDFNAYRAVSARFHEMLHETAPIVESVGIDEAYADLTGLPSIGGDAPRDASSGARAAAEALRARVRAELDIAVSVCIAGSRTTAKVGSDRAKPDGLIEVPVGEDAAFLAPFPIRELPLVGPKLGEALAKAGVRTIGQAASLDPRWLARQFGRAGGVLAEHARGVDATPVNGNGRVQRSISREVTFGEDIEDVRELEHVLVRHAERVGTDLRETGKRARTVTLKLRWHDFITLTRAHTLDRPAHATDVIAAAGRALLAETLAAEGMRPVRLIGLGVTNLVEDAMQLELGDLLPAFDGGELSEGATAPGGVLRAEDLDRALDEIRARFGVGSVTRGASGGRGAEPR